METTTTGNDSLSWYRTFSFVSRTCFCWGRPHHSTGPGSRARAPRTGPGLRPVPHEACGAHMAPKCFSCVSLLLLLVVDLLRSHCRRVTITELRHTLVYCTIEWQLLRAQTYDSLSFRYVALCLAILISAIWVWRQTRWLLDELLWKSGTYLIWFEVEHTNGKSSDGPSYDA